MKKLIFILSILTGCATAPSDAQVEKQVRSASSEELCYEHYMGRMGPRSSAVMDRVLIERGDDCTKYNMAELMEKEKVRLLRHQAAGIEHMQYQNQIMMMESLQNSFTPNRRK